MDGADVVLEAILDRCLVKKGNAVVPQVLVKWSKLPAASATWEDYYIVKKRFPDALCLGSSKFSREGRCHDQGVSRSKGVSIVEKTELIE